MRLKWNLKYWDITNYKKQNKSKQYQMLHAIIIVIGTKCYITLYRVQKYNFNLQSSIQVHGYSWNSITWHLISFQKHVYSFYS